MLETIKNIDSILAILDLSIAGIAIWCVKHCITITKQILILQKAQKAQMRAQLLKEHDLYFSRGYILQVELDEWINQYEAYHELVGPNAVLDDRKLNLLKLPTQAP